MVVVYGSIEGGDVEGKGFVVGNRVMGIDCVLRDLNGWAGDRMRMGITRTFGVLGGNGNRRRVLDF